MSENDEQRQRLFDFLTDNIFGRERDAVTRAIYEVAEGDPHSYPVGMATLLIACARQIARLPDNIQSGAREFRGILDKLVEVNNELGAKVANHQLQWKNDLTRATEEFMKGLDGQTSRTFVLFEAENMRVEGSWKQAVENLRRILAEADQVNRRLIPIADSARQIALEFSALKVELKLHAESHQRAIDAVDSVKTIHRENQKQGQDTQALIRSLTKEARANWITIGYLTGIFLAGLFHRMPVWAMWASFAALLALLQWLARREKKPSQEQPAANIAVEIPKSDPFGRT